MREVKKQASTTPNQSGVNTNSQLERLISIINNSSAVFLSQIHSSPVVFLFNGGLLFLLEGCWSHSRGAAAVSHTAITSGTATFKGPAQRVPLPRFRQAASVLPWVTEERAEAQSQ